MTNDSPKPSNPGQRVCGRLNMSRKMLLEFTNGKILAGKSVDISPRGILMQTDNPTEGELLGVAGTLFIISDDGQFSIGYPCKVTRQQDSSIALEIDKKAAAAFGNDMTKELLGH